MKGINKTVLMQAALAAAFGAGFNSDWVKANMEKLRRDLQNGAFAGYVPWALAAGVGYFLLKGK